MARTRIVSRMLTLLILFGVAGLAVGYFIFARGSDGSYYGIGDLFFPSNSGVRGIVSGVVDAFGGNLNTILGITQIQTNILICGGAGAVVGLLLGLFLPRRR